MQMNGKGFGIFAAAMLMLVMISIGIAGTGPKLVLYNATIIPDPVEPGDSVQLTLFLQNIEKTYCADRVFVQLSASYPLSLSGQDIQYIDQLCYNNTDAKVRFILPVDSLAQTGTYQVQVITKYEKFAATYSESNNVNVYVLGKPELDASVIASSPTDIYPGDSATITVLFQNNGNGRIESLSAKLRATEGIEVKWAGQEQGIGQITAHGKATANFQIEAPKDLAPGNYNLYVDTVYKAEGDTKQSRTFFFSVPIKEKAEFSATAANQGEMAIGNNNQVKITLKNSGYDEARKLKVRVRPLYPFSTDGTVRYIDSLAPGEEKNLEYTVTVDKDASIGTQVIGLLIEYENKEGNSRSDTVDLSLSARKKTLDEQVKEFEIYLIAIGAIIVLMSVKRIAGMMKGKKK